MKKSAPPQGDGEERQHLEFTSLLRLAKPRTLTVRLPPGYSAHGNQRYPVLYLHDGQNLFDPARAAFGVTWRAGETADRLTREGRLPPLILVGIDNTPERMDEYTLYHDPRRKQGGRASLYARFVFEEVKPFIDRTYRTLPQRRHTGVAGSSLGGLVSLTMAMSHAARFARCGILSPSLWWAKEAVFADVEGGRPWMHRLRFWLDMGTREDNRRGHVSAHLERTRRLTRCFDAAGLLPGRDFYYQEVAGGEHGEADWADRFDRVLLYLFGW
jgi:predicted alpha/beta superfamily hydrolase